MKHLILLVSFIAVFLELDAQGYWQQEVNYFIEVRLDDKNHELFGSEKIEYHNNSSDALTEIYMHLWPNAYKNGSTALARQKLENGNSLLYYASPQNRGYIDGLDFKVNGKKVDWEFDSIHIDICKLVLNEPLTPGNKILIATPFHVKIPKGIFSRLGHMGESYQITQWYPKPAVYDQDGWHPMPYLDQGEFYSEFGSFDVSITLPENYVVGATGDMVNGEEEMKWLEQRIANTEKYIEELENIIPEKEKKNGQDYFPTSSNETKTLRFNQSKVHDFAWFADKRWHVLKGEVKLPHSGKMVDTWVMFTDEEADLWKDGIEYMNHSVFYYSLWNGDYPYNHATAVDGALSAGGGMEYPNVTVIGRSGNAKGLETVIMHEVGHNWFYGILGSNERDHPWMDEGLNSFNENRYMETKYPGSKLLGNRADSRIAQFLDIDEYGHKTQYYLGYLFNARTNLDQPIEGTSGDYTMLNYGAIVYGKTALVWDYLMAYLGEEKMDVVMKKYFEKWKFKHPQPSDLKKTMQEVTGLDLNWFFDGMVGSNDKLDYKIQSFEKREDKLEVKIKNAGSINGPILLAGIKEGMPVQQQWYEGFQGNKQLDFPAGDYDVLRIDPDLEMPELNRKNNSIKTKGLLKKAEPFRLQLLGSLENPNKTQLFCLPTIGWNNYDRWMLGAAFYNSFVIQKKLDWVVMPMYSGTTGSILGSFDIGYNYLPKRGLFQNIRMSISGSRYSNGDNTTVLSSDKSLSEAVQASKLKPSITFEFRKKLARSPFNNEVQFSHYNLSFGNDPGLSCMDLTGNLCVLNLPADDYYVNKVTWSMYKAFSLNPYDFNITLEQGRSFVKASLEGNYTLTFKGKNKGLNIRVFTGRFLYNDQELSNSRFGFNMSGNRDYLYDEVLLGRAETEGLLSNQFLNNDGGFKSWVDNGVSQSWLSALNIQSSLHRKVPLALYVDLGWSALDPDNVYVGAGALLPIIPNLFEIYFPCYLSSGLAFPQYEKNIRFVLNLGRLNPFELFRGIGS